MFLIMLPSKKFLQRERGNLAKQKQTVRRIGSHR
jgi:hypothetical protein